MKKTAVAAIVAVALSSVAAARIGGWAVVSVEDIPDYLVAGKPTVFDFKIRQHGEHVLDDLKPEFTARKGFKSVDARVSQAPKGGYRATLTVPEPGDWKIAIAAKFGRSRGELLPIRAFDLRAKPAPLGDAERGRRMFAARGCVSCHVHRAVDIKGELSHYAPDLSNRRFPTEYLAEFLANPSIKPQTQNGARMPNLGLRRHEIAALVAFINGPSQVSAR